MNANLEFSKKEYELITNSDFILTKNRIIEKMYALYGMLSEEYKNVLNENVACLPNEIFKITPKIYKGEQYKNLPYVLLDYPRCFSKTDVFAVRSFFWWGNYFSITLQLSGKYLETYGERIFNFLNNEKNADWFLGVNESEWEHHFEKNNYLLFNEIKNISIADFKQRQFIKIASKLSLEKWETVTEFYLQRYKKLIEMLCRN